MTANLPRKISALGLFILLNSIVYKPLKAEVPARPPIIPQVIPRDIQPPSSAPLPTPQPQQSPLPQQILPPSNLSPNLEEQFPDTTKETFTVKRFEVLGGTVFSQQELDKVLKEFINRPITLDDLYQARQKITDLYIDKDYISCGAYIPPQKIWSGIVKIQIVETKLRDIEIEGTRRLNKSYIRSRIAAGNNGPLNQKRLLKSLQLLKFNPLIQNLSANLQPGNIPGQIKLVVEVVEARTFNAQMILDNTRSPSIGSFQRRIQVNEANLLGLGDNLSLGYSNTDASNFFYGSYTLPLNSKNGTLSFNYGTGNSSVIEHPFDTLNIKSASRYYELTFRQPMFQSPTEELTLGLTASRRESEANYAPLGEQIPFPQLGSNDQGKTRVSALRFFQEWITRGSTQVFAVRSQFNLGLDVFNATVNQDAPDSRFFSWQGQAQWLRLLAPDTLLLFGFNTQLATRSLLPLEQFSLGGIESVRGYRQDLLLADNGIFASAEVQVPILRISKINGILQLIPFTDFGIVWNNSGSTIANTNSPNILASIGLGLRWSQNANFSARLDYGIPVVSVDQPNQTWQENGLYFYLQYNNF
ncbi:ShlB/FhaC/HecB family hemolysin secretion/activation protein [Nostoc sp. FACHB-133]|uniref:ShlB/FhaC/HecB family hemolysin secretion/activation protein n=1 Tax=Nostoc sp. FACHB-133 TaxID=2692835 RepID=UPI0016826136|nr:ShlB/FhaC/HecB family hemolysin secretion/activation protein [Nostoc sp. FACHB-133]MBD2527584.1 ShlB/FhaC/HecB family hemolysin secretion/activation protein [Nostoc sp. FACHB-133]